jgi:hypothetical protein
LGPVTQPTLVVTGDVATAAALVRVVTTRVGLAGSVFDGRDTAATLGLVRCAWPTAEREADVE